MNETKQNVRPNCSQAFLQAIPLTQSFESFKELHCCLKQLCHASASHDDWTLFGHKLHQETETVTASCRRFKRSQLLVRRGMDSFATNLNAINKHDSPLSTVCVNPACKACALALVIGGNVAATWSCPCFAWEQASSVSIVRDTPVS